MINSNISSPSSLASGRHAHAVILAIVTLDAIGISLVMPIVPSLLREVGHTGDLGWRFGAFLSLYALMQFLCAPVLGALSDRFGRRPVLLVSVLGAAQQFAVHRIEQRPLVPEMPVKRRLLHAQPLGQQPGAELVHSDLVEQPQGGLEDHFAVQFHSDVHADVDSGGYFTARNLSLIIPYQ